MFPFLRFSAVTASIIVASTAFGFGLATTMLSAKEVAHADISNGPSVVSPGSQSRGNLETRSIAGYRSINVVLATRSISFDNVPAINAEGPTPSAAHANMGRRTRELVSACLMASMD